VTPPCTGRDQTNWHKFPRHSACTHAVASPLRVRSVTPDHSPFRDATSAGFNRYSRSLAIHSHVDPAFPRLSAISFSPRQSRAASEASTLRQSSYSRLLSRGTSIAEITRKGDQVGNSGRYHRGSKQKRPKTSSVLFTFCYQLRR